MANIFRTISTKFYQNRLGFIDDVTKTFGVCEAAYVDERTQ